MNRKNIYLLLCVLGVALPYCLFLPWVATNGLNLSLFLQQLFTNRIGAFFGMDVLAIKTPRQTCSRSSTTWKSALAKESE